MGQLVPNVSEMLEERRWKKDLKKNGARKTAGDQLREHMKKSETFYIYAEGAGGVIDETETKDGNEAGVIARAWSIKYPDYIIWVHSSHGYTAMKFRDGEAILKSEDKALDERPEAMTDMTKDEYMYPTDLQSAIKDMISTSNGLRRFDAYIHYSGLMTYEQYAEIISMVETKMAEDPDWFHDNSYEEMARYVYANMTDTSELKKSDGFHVKDAFGKVIWYTEDFNEAKGYVDRNPHYMIWQGNHMIPDWEYDSYMNKATDYDDDPETKEDAEARAKELGSSYGTAQSDDGSWWVTPAGITSHDAKRAYAESRASGKPAENSAKIAWSVQNKTQKMAKTLIETYRGYDLVFVNQQLEVHHNGELIGIYPSALSAKYDIDERTGVVHDIRAGLYPMDKVKKSKGRMKKNEEDYMDDEYHPDEDDIFITQERNGRMYVSQLEETFDDYDEMDEAIRDWMNRHSYYPNVWEVSDHGNIHMYSLSKSKMKKGAVVTNPSAREMMLFVYHVFIPGDEDRRYMTDDYDEAVRYAENLSERTGQTIEIFDTNSDEVEEISKIIGTLDTAERALGGDPDDFGAVGKNMNKSFATEEEISMLVSEGFSDVFNDGRVWEYDLTMLGEPVDGTTARVTFTNFADKPLLYASIGGRVFANTIGVESSELRSMIEFWKMTARGHGYMVKFKSAVLKEGNNMQKSTDKLKIGILNGRGEEPSKMKKNEDWDSELSAIQRTAYNFINDLYDVEYGRPYENELQPLIDSARASAKAIDDWIYSQSDKYFE